MANTDFSAQEILNMVYDSTHQTLKTGGVFHETFDGPANGTTTAVHAAVAGDGTLQTINTAITNPDYPRCLTVTESGAGAGSGDVTITGTDVRGDVITEKFTITNDGTTQGSIPFATVTSFTIPATCGATSSISVGTNNKLGMMREGITFTKTCADGTHEATGTTNEDNGTIIPTTAPNGVVVFDIWYVQ